MTDATDFKTVWSPLPKQQLALECPVDDILYGGAVGGGKTDLLVAGFVRHAAQAGHNAQGGIFRRTLPELRQIMRRCDALYPQVGAVWKETTRTWTFPNKATLLLSYLETDADARRYQGHEFTYLGVDEAGAFAKPDPIDYLRSRMRSPAEGVRKQLILTANPGGTGQDWLANAYVNGHQPYTPFQDPETGLWRVYIPSRLTDNPYLMRDPEYRQRIRGSGPSWLVRALLLGDWTTSVAGRIFMPDWWWWYRDGALPPLRTVIQAWDTDFGSSSGSSCAGITLGIGHNRVYLLDIFNESLEFPALLRQVQASAAQHKPSAIIIEKKASGQSLLQSLRDSTSLPLIDGVKDGLPKLDHWLRNSSFVEARRFALCQDNPAHVAYAKKLQAAGTDAQDEDLNDATSYALDYARHRYSYGVLEDYTAPQPVLSGGKPLPGATKRLTLSEINRVLRR
jgi:phage terminase large subunit-like protein